MTKTHLKNRESGFTLLELLLVIGVAALFWIGGIVTYRLVTDGNKATDATRLLLTIRQEAQTMAQQQNGVYTGIKYDSTTAAGATPGPMITSGVLRDQQGNPFNGAIKIDPATPPGGAADGAISVEFDNLSQSGCMRLATAINTPSEVISITANGTAVGTTIPVTAADVAAGCNKSSDNSLVWVFP